MLLESLVRDVMLSLRVLHRHSPYSLTALLTLALGLATTTAMFAVIDATLLRPLPFADPDRLVSLSSLLPGPSGEEIQYALSEIEIVRWREATTMLAGVEALQPRSMGLTGAGQPEGVRGGAWRWVRAGGIRARPREGAARGGISRRTRQGAPAGDSAARDPLRAAASGARRPRRRRPAPPPARVRERGEPHDRACVRPPRGA